MKTFVPPIKSQGIKTKLVHWINEAVEQIAYDRWVEPFMGTGVVAFNVRPKKALLGDSNPHIINFYKSLQDKSVTQEIVRAYLVEEGQKLLDSKGTHYYEVRKRFNDSQSSLDFLFLSRACFNGMMRFNKKGGFNVPFCKKPNRFAQALVTKICNQVKYISEIIDDGDYEFQNCDFSQTLNDVTEKDLVYADPPYLGRNVDYFDSWNEEDELLLNKLLESSNTKFILSTWLKNKYRTNNFVFDIWHSTQVLVKEHFYHVGGTESNRNAVYEALLTNQKTKASVSVNELWNILEDQNLNTLIKPVKVVKNSQIELSFTK